MRPSRRLTAAVAAGGAAGAAGRHLVDVGVPDPTAYPWTTPAINVVGSFLLALLPALAAVRRSPLLAAALGPGLLGGFTTLSAYAEESRGLLADGRPAAAAAYVVGTLLACVLAVLLADLVVRRHDRRRRAEP